MVKQPNDDLFEGTTMTFGEHLDELRTVLFRSIIGLLVCVVFGFFVADEVIELVQGPLKKALEQHYKDKAILDLEGQVGKENITPEMENVIQEKGYIPEPAYIDLEILTNRLRDELPDHFSGISYKSSQFGMADFPAENARNLCKAIVEDKAKTDDASAIIWGLLNEDDQKVIEKCGETEKLSREDRRSLLAVMNRLIEKPELHSAGAFSELATGKHEKAMTERRDNEDSETEFSDADTRRLNRLLLYVAYERFLLLPQPILLETPILRPISIRVQTLNAHEAFMIWLKAALVAGLVMSSPWIFFQVWSFVAAGLYPHERKYVYFYLPFSLGLFFAGAAMAFFFVFEHVLRFLFSFNRMMDIDPDPRISEWLGFVLMLPIGFGIAFQLPLGMLFLYRLGVFSLEAYLAKWRIAILIIFVLSMILTPADPISMLLLAMPLTALYFLGIVLCRWLPRTRNKFPEGHDPN